MEHELLQWLTAQLAEHPPNKAVRLGIGDDAALLEFDQDQCVITSDMLMDGTDFRIDQHDLQRVGRKALAVNLSDLAAMAVEPVAALVNLALPQENALHIAQQLFTGMLPLARRFQVAIAGGDTNVWAGPLVISITALGRSGALPPLRRSGAQPGDSIVVTGTFGGSITGKHFDFTPRIEEALRLHGHYDVHAACDVSDGLALDLARIAQASGCGATVIADHIPLSHAVLAQYPDDQERARRHALGDGEDFELILAVPPGDADRMLLEQTGDVPLSRIGWFTAERTLWLERMDGARQPLPPLGYIHGAKELP